MIHTPIEFCLPDAEVTFGSPHCRFGTHTRGHMVAHLQFDAQGLHDHLHSIVTQTHDHATLHLPAALAAIMHEFGLTNDVLTILHELESEATA